MTKRSTCEHSYTTILAEPFSNAMGINGGLAKEQMIQKKHT